MSSLKIRKVGNSLGVIFPKEVQDTLNISEGDIIDITTVGGNKVVLDSHLPHHSKWTFKGADLSKEDAAWIDADLEEENDKTP
ncbi:MAG: AbrB/MazE/SpoVT family DNA-binding domain-containing protein [Bdellovibrionaceae bacterium]|nr:AbrB/MazE/SpoVT family DNA-binding domain-containing protein [Pseudobdellovibrionaceae bacterium]